MNYKANIHFSPKASEDSVKREEPCVVIAAKIVSILLSCENVAVAARGFDFANRMMSGFDQWEELLERSKGITDRAIEQDIIRFEMTETKAGGDPCH